MATVSVVVPAFNAEPWLQQCLDSIHAQTYGDVELIVIEDPQGRGAAAARNLGLEKATGEFVTFCDADDYLEPDAIENLMAASDGTDMVAGSFRKFGDFEQVVTHRTDWLSMERVAEYVMQNLQNPRQNQMLSGCWAKLYRRSLIKPFPDLTTAEDLAFNFDYLTRCGSIRFISEVVYNNRKRAGSLSTTFNENDKPGLFGFLEGLTYVEGFLARFYYGHKIRQAINNSKVYHSMLYFMRICEQESKPFSEISGLMKPSVMRDSLMRLYP